MTVHTVADGNTPNSLSNEQLGRFHRRTGELLRRLNERTLDFERVMEGLQLLAEAQPLPAVLIQQVAQPVSIPETLVQWHLGWPAFLKRHDLPEMELPAIDLVKYQPGFDWSVVDPQGLTTNQAFTLCEKIFKGKVWKWQDDLDTLKIVTNQAKQVEGARAILVRAGVESDKQWCKKHALQVEERGVLCLTPRKYLLLAARLKEEKDVLLNVKGWTLFSGFRDTDGVVPNSYWHRDLLRVDRGSLGCAFPSGGAREVIIL
jgi:hypothetical protein